MITTITILDKIHQLRPEYISPSRIKFHWLYDRVSLIWKNPRTIDIMDYPDINPGELFYVRINCSNGDAVEVGISKQERDVLSKEYVLFVNKFGNLVAQNISCIYIEFNDFFRTDRYVVSTAYFDGKFRYIRSYYEDGEVINFINNKISRVYESNIRLISGDLIIIDELFITDLDPNQNLTFFVHYFELYYHIIVDTKSDNTLLFIDQNLEHFLGRRLTRFILNEAEKDNINLIYPCENS